MPRELKIVQFIHDGPEHIVCKVKDSDTKLYIDSNSENLEHGNLPWHAGPDKLAHRRKFMLAKGKSIDKNNNLVEGDITFWGEWEAPSRYHKIKYEEKVSDEYPKYIHYKRFIENTNRNRMNTDPNVFGKEFHYCCCKQEFLKNILQNLEVGSIILFGSAKGKGENYRFILDTVFVVGKYELYNSVQAELLLCQHNISITENYYLTSIKPLKDGDTAAGLPKDYTLYSGASINSDNRYFSFFPCKRAKITNISLDSREISEYAFERPSLDIVKYGLGKLNRSIKGTIIDELKKKEEYIGLTDSEVVGKYWDMLVQDLRCRGLDLGAFAEEPVEE